MKAVLMKAEEEYVSLLKTYLQKETEFSLEKAYELGRRAIIARAGLLEFSEIYRKALAEIMENDFASAEIVRRVGRATDFFLESLAPFEMAQRGFQETCFKLLVANETLQKAHDELEHRVEERTRELASSNADLQQFAYAVSHDLQDPLWMVTGYLKLLVEHYQTQIDAKAREWVGEAVAGGSRMQAMITDLLSYSRLGAAPPSPAAVACSTILRDTLSNLKVAIEKNGAVVTSGPLPEVRVEASQLTLLFQNLIGNAIKFRRKEEPPRIHLSAEQIETASSQKRKEWLFSIRDNGIGVDPQHKERVFIVFQRLHKEGEYPGTGMGLAICKRIVERHGGRIWVEPTPDGGSVFYFTLPVVKGQ